MKKSIQTYCFDIDGTICQNTFGKYELAEPIQDRISFINKLYDEGCEIVMFTARGSTTGIDWTKFTKKQLEQWGLKYTKLILGKPYAELFIDDKGIEANQFFYNELPKSSNSYFAKIAKYFHLLDIQKDIYKKIDDLANEIAESFKKGGKLFFAGNGGSFADAQHITAEFISKLKIDRNPLPSILLGGNSSSLTAIGNDYGFNYIFSREFEALAQENDVLITITTSGESENIINLLKSANQMNVSNWCITSAKKSRCCTLSKIISTPTEVKEVANIQELHIAIGHLLCMKTEEHLFR